MREYKVDLCVPFSYYVEAESLEDAIKEAFEEFYAEEDLISTAFEAEVLNVKEV